MEYSDEYLREVLPRQDPPSDFIPVAVNEEIARWIERDEIKDRELIARSTRWTYALFNELRLNQIKVEWVDHPFWAFGAYPLTWMALPLTVGLFDPRTEPQAFGFIAHIPPTAGRRRAEMIVAEIRFPRLDATFPLNFREASFEEHALDHPVNATSASWARCNNTANLWGVLTAGHAVQGISLGQLVQFSGGQGFLLRSHHPVIDAAFIGTGLPVTMPKPLPIRRFPAAGQPVMVELKSGSVRRTIVHVDSTMQVVNTRAFPVQLFLDSPFVKGDSGALVRTSVGEAVGIYLGSLQTPAVPTGLAGRALNFEQATLALNVTAFL